MDSQQVKISVSLGITYGAATIVTCLRFFSRLSASQRLWLDDFLIIPAFIGATFRTVVFAHALELGLGLPSPEIARIIEEHGEAPHALTYLTFINNFGWPIALGFAKLSICALYWRLFQYSCIRNGIRIVAGLNTAWMIAVILSMALQCIPIEAAWNEEVSGTCVNTLAENTWPVVTHLIIDMAILGLLWVQVYRLQLPGLQRLGIAMLFMFGVCICVLAVVVLALTVQWAETDCYSSKEKCLSYYTSIYQVSAAEPNLIVVSASIPTLAPLYRKIVGSHRSEGPSCERAKDPLDCTQHKRHHDTFDEDQLGAHDDPNGSTHAFAEDSPYALEDMGHSEVSEGHRSDGETKDGAKVMEIRLMGP